MCVCMSSIMLFFYLFYFFFSNYITQECANDNNIS